MPNIGRPSKACTACKRRRVKCSETPPRCRGCIKLNLSCEWKDVSIFREQESWAEMVVMRRVQQAKSLRGEYDMDTLGTLAIMRPPPKQLTVDMETCALNRFYLEYAYTAGTFPFLYLVAPLYEQSSTPACLRSAVRAVSLATTAKHLRRYEMMERARSYYGTALKDLATALNKAEVAKHDGVLIALCLLCLYETVTYAGTKKSIELNRVHSQGRLAVLRLRGPQQLRRKAGRNLFVLLYHQHLLGSFQDGGHVLEEYEMWLRVWYPNTPIARLVTLMHEVSRLVIEIKEAVSQQQTHLVRQLLERGKLMEGSLSTVVQDFLGSWPDIQDIRGRLTGRDRLPDLPKQLRFDVEDLPDSLDRYTTITKALVANIFRAIRIRLLQSLSMAVTHLVSSSDSGVDLIALPERFSMVMQQVSESICNDVPLAISDDGEQQDGGRETTRFEDTGNAPMVLHHYDNRRQKHRIHGRGMRAWSMLFPLESAINVVPLSDGLRGRLAQVLENTKRIVGIDLGAETGI